MFGVRDSRAGVFEVRGSRFASFLGSKGLRMAIESMFGQVTGKLILRLECLRISGISFRSLNLRDRQEITWTFACPIAPHLGTLLNRKIRDVERLRLWFRSIGRDPIWGTLGPQIVQLISCRPLNT